MPLFKSGLSNPTAHFLNSSCAFTAPAVAIVADLVGNFLVAGADAVCKVGTTPALAVLVFGGTGGGAIGVFAFPPAPTVVQALPIGGLGADTFPARLA